MLSILQIDNGCHPFLYLVLFNYDQVSRRINTAIHRQKNYNLLGGRSRSLEQLQNDIRQGHLDPSMRHQLLSLRRGHCVQDVLSTSTIRSPHHEMDRTCARPGLMDIFSQLEESNTSESGGVYRESEGRGGKGGVSTSSTLRRRPMSERYSSSSTPSPYSYNSHGTVMVRRNDLGEERKSDSTHHHSTTHTNSHYQGYPLYSDESDMLSLSAQNIDNSLSSVNLKEIKNKFRAHAKAASLATTGPPKLARSETS